MHRAKSLQALRLRVDGRDYNWVSASKKFSNLDEINQVMENKTLFKRFSLTRNRGIFQDEFTLDAELSALNIEMPSNDTG